MVTIVIYESLICVLFASPLECRALRHGTFSEVQKPIRNTSLYFQHSPFRIDSKSFCFNP